MKLKDLLKESTKKYKLQVIEHIKFGKTGQATADGYMYDVEDNEIKVKLEIDYSLAEKDSMSGPGHDTEAEITEITMTTGEKVSLNDVEYDSDNLVEEISDAASDR